MVISSRAQTQCVLGMSPFALDMVQIGTGVGAIVGNGVGRGVGVKVEKHEPSLMSFAARYFPAGHCKHWFTARHFKITRKRPAPQWIGTGVGAGADNAS